MRTVFLLFAAGGCLVLAQNVPSQLQPPPDEKLILKAQGAGDQIYGCKQVDSSYAWVLKAPDARLLGPDGSVIGRHFAGPTWESKDGSKVMGKVVASLPSPDAQSVPWLLLHASGHEGSGVMSHVLSIQRLDTKGGKAPAMGCDSSHAGAEVRVPYKAEYYFYGGSAQQ